jgi:hypothetical protein
MTGSFPHDSDEAPEMFRKSHHQDLDTISSVSHITPFTSSHKKTPHIPHNTDSTMTLVDTINKIMPTDSRYEDDERSRGFLKIIMTKWTIHDDLQIGQHQDFDIPEFLKEEVENESSSMPVEIRLHSKNWKIRSRAMEEVSQLFEMSEPQDKVFEFYAEDVVKFLMDPNPSVQKQAIETLKTYINESDCSLLNTKLCTKILVKKIFSKNLKTLDPNAMEVLYFLFEKSEYEQVVQTLVRLLGDRRPKVTPLISS